MQRPRGRRTLWSSEAREGRVTGKRFLHVCSWKGLGLLSRTLIKNFKQRINSNRFVKVTLVAMWRTNWRREYVSLK